MKKIAAYTFLIILSGLTGCKKFLEKEPDNRTTVTTPEQVTQLLTTAYPHANYIPFAEAMSDNSEDKGVSDPSVDPNSAKVNSQSYLYQVVETNDLDSPDFYWYGCYKAIAAANEALEVIAKARDTAAFRAQKGEALVARAYAHFMLVTLYAKCYDPATAATDIGIPYVTAPEKTVFGQYDRKTVKYVYDMIEKDLNAGIPLINDKIYNQAPKFHFTTAAAHAFASRFYLFKQDYAQVVAHANLAISGNIADYFRPWNSTYLNLQPVELRLQYASATEPANLLLQETQSVWSRSFPYYRFAMYNYIHDVVMNGDNPTNGNFAIGSKVYGAQPRYYNVPKWYEHFVYTSSTANFGDPYVTVPLFTAEEVAFNRAEANARLHNYTASLADLNAWVSKNIISYNAAAHNLTESRVTAFYGGTSETALVNTVLQFKRVFYIEEGMRWFDIIRLKIPVTHQTNEGLRIDLPADDKRRILQLPKEANLSGVPLNPR
jgi:hypothetical protein